MARGQVDGSSGYFYPPSPLSSTKHITFITSSPDCPQLNLFHWNEGYSTWGLMISTYLLMINFWTVSRFIKLRRIVKFLENIFCHLMISSSLTLSTDHFGKVWDRVSTNVSPSLFPLTHFLFKCLCLSLHALRSTVHNNTEMQFRQSEKSTWSSL